MNTTAYKEVLLKICVVFYFELSNNTLIQNIYKYNHIQRFINKHFLQARSKAGGQKMATQIVNNTIKRTDTGELVVREHATRWMKEKVVNTFSMYKDLIYKIHNWIHICGAMITYSWRHFLKLYSHMYI